MLGFVYSVQGLSACFKSSSPFLVYLCGRITAPHTGLACVLHRLESLSWFCVCAEISREEEKKDWMEKALASCGCGLTFLFNVKC